MTAADQRFAFETIKALRETQTPVLLLTKVPLPQYFRSVAAIAIRVAGIIRQYVAGAGTDGFKLRAEKVAVSLHELAGLTN
jgi:hypothetical protein